jgi:glucose-1-phosphate cytidylyltransferase
VRNPVKVVILCGGQGTRLREETEFRPKPMVTIGQRPILWHIMKLYAHRGFREFVLCLGYRGSVIKEYFLNYEAMNNDFTVHLGSNTRLDYHDLHGEQDFQVTLAETGAETMTGGRIQRAARYIDGDTFLMTYGDGLADVDVGKLLDFHKSHGKLATVTAVRPTSRFGVMAVSDDHRVTSFAEKPRLDGWVSAGFFALDRKVVDYIEGGDECVFERQPMERLAAEGQLMVYRHDGYFFAMDTYREFQELNAVWDRGEAPWKVWKD